MVEDTLELSIALRTVGEVAALGTEVDGAQLASASEWVEEVVDELVASHATLVAALQTVGEVALLEELVPEDAEPALCSGEQMLAISAELQLVAGVVESLQLVQGALHAQDVGVLVSGHSHQLLLCIHLRISHCLSAQPLSPRQAQFEGVVAELIHFHQPICMSHQQMLMVRGELHFPSGGGVEVQSLEGGELVVGIVVDEYFMAIIADG